MTVVPESQFVCEHVQMSYNLRFLETRGSRDICCSSCRCSSSYCCGKLKEKNLVQCINIQFCVNIGKSTKECLAVSCHDYARIKQPRKNRIVSRYPVLTVDLVTKMFIIPGGGSPTLWSLTSVKE